MSGTGLCPCPTASKAVLYLGQPELLTVFGLRQRERLEAAEEAAEEAAAAGGLGGAHHHLGRASFRYLED